MSPIKTEEESIGELLADATPPNPLGNFARETVDHMLKGLPAEWVEPVTTMAQWMVDRLERTQGAYRASYNEAESVSELNKMLNKSLDKSIEQRDTLREQLAASEWARQSEWKASFFGWLLGTMLTLGTILAIALLTRP